MSGFSPYTPLPPRAGEAYSQLGVKLVVLRVTESHVHFCSKSPNYTGPTLSITLDEWLGQITDGSVTPWEDE